MRRSSHSSDEQINAIEKMFAKVEERMSYQNGRLITIPKIPPALGNILGSKRFVPKLIAIGPYHSGECHSTADDHKPLWAKRFILDSKQQVKVLYQKIERKIQELRNCYDEEAIRGYDNKELTRMFLLDGCALLHLIRCFCCTGKEDGLIDSNLKIHRIAYIQKDLFLLENQLPFEVLKLLLQDAEFQDPNYMEEMIKDFTISMVTKARGRSGMKLKYDENEPFHLLDLLRSVHLGKLKKISKLQEIVVSQQPQQNIQEGDEKGQAQGDGMQQFEWLFTLAPGIRTFDFTGISDKEHEISIWNSYRNVQELMAVGIHFRPSETTFLTDISFTSYLVITGCLKLPSVVIDSSTLIIFLNLIAQESLTNLTDFSVISYLCFLDSLITHWEDVKELQAARVLNNFLENQEEMVQFFKHVCGKLIPDLNSYKDVRQQIQEHVEGHYNSKLSMWLIRSKDSPWRVIGFVCALLGLFLIAVQT